MSKSKGNVISPFEAANDYSDDGLRYFILREAVPQNDASKTSYILLVMQSKTVTVTTLNILEW